MARAGVTYIINEVRRLSTAGTNEFTAGTVAYYSDNEIQRILDSRRGRLSREEMVFEPELDYSGTGSAIYTRARVGYGWLEDVSSGGSADYFVITDSQGSVIGTSNYTLYPEDGYIVFNSNQRGSSRYVSGWSHNPYVAALDVLTSWQTQLSMQPDWETDNMRVRRSQKSKAIGEQIKWLRSLSEWSPRVRTSEMWRNDMSEGEK